MINLIPNQEKKKMANSLYFRLVIVFILALGFSLLIALIALLPSYILSFMQRGVVNERLEAQKRETIPELDQQTLVMVRDINQKLELLENANKNNFLVSRDVINEITMKKMPDIKITRFSYENDLAKGEKIIINGEAPSRERLLLFRQILENDPMFSKVDLPISNFVRGSDIQFSLSLIPA